MRKTLLSTLLSMLMLTACSTHPAPEPESQEVPQDMTDSVQGLQEVWKAQLPEPLYTREQDEPESQDFRSPVMITGGTGRTVALTFDDGPSPYTEEILDILQEKNVYATFCVIGSQVEQYPDILRRIVVDGHELCNHSMHHRMDMYSWSTAAIVHDLESTDEIIADIVGEKYKPVYYRAPGGMFGGNTSRALEEIGMRPVHWTVDPRDWSKPGVDAIIDNVLTNVEPKSIVLLHDGGGSREQTIAALPEIIDALVEEGYEFSPLRP